MEALLRAIHDCGFDLKAPRKLKAPTFVKLYGEAKTQAGVLFTDTLGQDVLLDYYSESAMQQLEERTYDFSQVDSLKEGSSDGMDSWDEETRQVHQMLVAVKESAGPCYLPF